jgi:hypothetical protein
MLKLYFSSIYFSIIRRIFGFAVIKLRDYDNFIVGQVFYKVPDQVCDLSRAAFEDSRQIFWMIGQFEYYNIYLLT